MNLKELNEFERMQKIRTKRIKNKFFQSIEIKIKGLF